MEGQTIEILGVPYQLKRVDTISREELRIGEIDFLTQEILLLKGLGNGAGYALARSNPWDFFPARLRGRSN